MKAIVIYESMYGNTHLVADGIADGLRDGGLDAVVVPVGEASAAVLDGADVVVVGGPTHVHGMSRPTSRKAAIDDAQKPERGLTLDPDAEGDGLREWFEALGELALPAAAYDTRLDAAPALTGRASKGIAKRLRKHGAELVAEPESFLVTKENRLEPDEVGRAREWGATLAAALVPSSI
jgi:menaquinone-dependent protoporphyrinogen IX oxidase